MKPYLISLGAGLLIGMIYSLLNVRSPAPPMIALVGLLGILIGEQLLPITRRTMVSEPVANAAARGPAAPEPPLPSGNRPSAQRDAT